MGVDIITIISAVLVLVLYGIYLLYSPGARPKYSGEELKEKIKKASLGMDESGMQTSGLSLVKTVPESYFKSKLPKVEGLKEWIQHAGLNIQPYIVVAVGLTFGFVFGMLFFLLIHSNILLSLLLGIIISFFVPWAFLMFLISRRRKYFLQEFPIALDIIMRALRAGHSVDRAISMVVEQMPAGLVGPVFKQIVDKLHVGGTFEDVLGELANRIGIDEFRMLAIVIVLQRETGGSLAEAVENFAKIIRSRHQLKQKVKALTSEVRVTAMILTAIPFVIFFVVYLTTPNYFDVLFYTENGHLLLVAGLGMLVVGIGVILRMAYKENY